MEDIDQDFGESDKIIIRNTYLKNFGQLYTSWYTFFVDISDCLWQLHRDSLLSF